MIIAVDFDGTLCKNAYPEIGSPNKTLINYLIEKKIDGDKLILWSCREGIYLQKAVEWCEQYGLYFDAVNDNLPEHIEKFKNNSRKIFADYYIDDRAEKPRHYYNRSRKKTFKEEQKESIRTAKELYYGEDVINALRKAESIPQLFRILKDARTFLIDSED